MSEYQYVVFQAVDGPLNDQQLEFARRQSTRAEVTRWSLSVEYHYSSFRGDVDGLLRHGYDVYLQHTNYGIREIRLRLPGGIPVPKRVWSKYVDGEKLCCKSDAVGPGAIVSLCPYYEPGSLEEVWETQKYLDAAVYVRDRLMRGDLRALYLLWLCAANDEYSDRETIIEPPVPHGIADIAPQGGELLSFFGLDPLLLVAAGVGIEAAPADDEAGHGAFSRWVEELDNQRAKHLLLQLLTGDAAIEKASLLSEIRSSRTPVDWPTSDSQRSFDQLLQNAAALRGEENAKQVRQARAAAKRAAAKAERQRADRMQEMREAPDRWLHEAERLVDARGTENYQAAADILHDLREAIGGEQGDLMARRSAARLAKKYPTLNRLKSALRKRGLLGP